MCGEKTAQTFKDIINTGSPPRVRGKVVLLSRFSAFWRITPACAGKSFPRRARHGCRWDHPRVCGEKDTLQPGAHVFVGSPPRVRGKAPRPPCPPSLPGITPACAGKSDWFLGLPPGRPDHPRVCGEKLDRRLQNHPSQGSPPRVRGKAGPTAPKSSLSGITPACAGKSIVLNLVQVNSRDHPRVCGEKCHTTIF